MNLAVNVRRLRKEKGISQTKLAELIGSHPNHITRLETGKYTPSLENVIKLSEVFAVSLDELVYGTNGTHGEIRIEDQVFAEKIKLLNSLDEEERNVIIKYIDAILTKKKMLNFLQSKEA